MKRTLRTFLPVLLALGAGAAACAAESHAAGPAASGDGVAQQCLRVRDAAPPAADLPAAPPPGSCDAQLLYYDTRDNPAATPADWAQVRGCAFAQHDTAVLMMLYANGLGVAQNRDLALSYACRLGGAPLELQGRAERLARLEPDGATAFDQCDDASSRLLINTCAAIAERRSVHAYDARLAKITRRWPPGDKAALLTLQTRMQAFAEARGRHEADLARSLGPLLAPAAETARAAEAEQFLSDLERCERRRFPAYSAEQYAGLDDQLNQAYLRLLQTAPGAADGVRLSERAWLQYRDAWVAFGHARYPAVPPHAWKAQLTERRIRQLRELQKQASRRK